MTDRMWLAVFRSAQAHLRLELMNARRAGACIDPDTTVAVQFIMKIVEIPDA